MNRDDKHGDISAHIQPFQGPAPLVSLGKNAEGVDDPDHFSFIETGKTEDKDDSK
ncbi:hypothetical protein RGU11_13315 [Rossellomorea marisflavi]|uniref:hypothetical protein n=1 Tax=Rossellomorea marisflavi TaxID=189381 RepID=UPI00135A6E8D|nr:hypothetical protein [Rossellomorea marisflavi]MDR4937367.1 hypothetical protein [Rossellomorea marisflavi]